MTRGTCDGVRLNGTVGSRSVRLMEAIRVTALAGDQKLGPFAAEPTGAVLIGRAAINGMVLSEEWAPRVLATLVPTERCWLVVNGPSARMEVRNNWIECVMPTDSILALPSDVTDLRWPSLSDHLLVKLTIGGLVDSSMALLLPELDDADDLREGFVGTAWALGERKGPDLLEPQQRHAMAHLFRHLLEGTPRPKNIVRPAADYLGVTVDALKKQATRVRNRVNNDRFQKLRTLDELGEYLVERAQVVTSADLEAGPTARAAIAGARRARRARPRP